LPEELVLYFFTNTIDRNSFNIFSTRTLSNGNSKVEKEDFGIL
jgi:hypothetical protein